jgi:hypothetical protein
VVVVGCMLMFEMVVARNWTELFVFESFFFKNFQLDPYKT